MTDFYVTKWLSCVNCQRRIDMDPSRELFIDDLNWFLCQHDSETGLHNLRYTKHDDYDFDGSIDMVEANEHIELEGKISIGFHEHIKRFFLAGNEGPNLFCWPKHVWAWKKIPNKIKETLDK